MKFFSNLNDEILTWLDDYHFVMWRDLSFLDEKDQDKLKGYEDCGGFIIIIDARSGSIVMKMLCKEFFEFHDDEHRHMFMLKCEDRIDAWNFKKLIPTLSRDTVNTINTIDNSDKMAYDDAWLTVKPDYTIYYPDGVEFNSFEISSNGQDFISFVSDDNTFTLWRLYTVGGSSEVKIIKQWKSKKSKYGVNDIDFLEPEWDFVEALSSWLIYSLSNLPLPLLPIILLYLI